MKVSVIIPTRYRPIEFGYLLWSLFSQQHRPAEIVVVDQSDGTSTEQVVNNFRCLSKTTDGEASALIYFHDPTIRGASQARNVGVRVSTGDILLFLDDDEILEPDFIHELLRVYASDPGVGGVSGVVTNYPLPALGSRILGRIFWRGPFRDERQPIYWKADRLRGASPIPVRKFGSGVMSVRRSVLCADRFDDSLEGLPPGEDVDLCCRLSARTTLVITPRARLINLMSSTGRARRHWLETDAQATYYLYRRNWKWGAKNRLAFLWLNIGYCLFAGAACVSRGSSEPWQALRAGIQRARLQGTG